MKRFRVRESYLVSGWTYVNAETKEQAIKFIEEGEGYFENENDRDEEHQDIFWKTFEEIKEKIL